MQIGEREQLISELVTQGSTASLDVAALAELESWSMSLDVNGEFSRYSAWMARDLLGLPLNDDLGDVRSPDLPEGMPVMTMRSLSPYSEQPGSDD